MYCQNTLLLPAAGRTLCCITS